MITPDELPPAHQSFGSLSDIPEAPPWREFDGSWDRYRGTGFLVSDQDQSEIVRAAMCLRRPILVTGLPGTGKSSLAYAVADALGLGSVLRWSITTRSTLQQGLYTYDAIGRLQEASMVARRLELQLLRSRHNNPGGEVTASTATETDDPVLDIGRFIALGPLGTSLLPDTSNTPPRPKVLLIDEIDKGDIDLPNDLLHVFEEGRFEIPELRRHYDEYEARRVLVRVHDSSDRVEVPNGQIVCNPFPVVIMTSNGERAFPQAFLRRCLRLDIRRPDKDQLAAIVERRLEGVLSTVAINDLISTFIHRRDDLQQLLSTDQLLNAVFLRMSGIDILATDKKKLLEMIWHSLSEPNS